VLLWKDLFFHAIVFGPCFLPILDPPLLCALGFFEIYFKENLTYKKSFFLRADLDILCAHKDIFDIIYAMYKKEKILC
jgi:hypothetical protein